MRLTRWYTSSSDGVCWGSVAIVGSSLCWGRRERSSRLLPFALVEAVDTEVALAVLGAAVGALAADGADRRLGVAAPVLPGGACECLQAGHQSRHPLVRACVLPLSP